MSPTKKHRRFVLLALVVDALAITLSLLVAYQFRFFTVVPVRGDVPEVERYLRTLVVVIPVYLWFFRAYGLYQIRRQIRRIEEIFLVIKAVSLSTLILMALTFFYRGFLYSRIYLVFLWLFSIMLVSFARYLLIQWEYWRKSAKKEMTRVILIGANHNARNIIRWARQNPHYGQEIIGVLSRDEGLVDKHLEGIPIVGVSEECEKVLERLVPDRVVLLDPAFSRERITDLVAFCEDQWMEFQVAADFYGLMTRHVDVENIAAVPLLGFRSLPLDDFWNRSAKRIFDILVSSFLMLATLPLWILAVFLIKREDGGPVFYAQERVGRDRKILKLLKFRTMKVDAERETGPVWAKPNDDRRTKTGNFLRRTNIDELPQLLNVLKGEMTLVGPRPERPHFVDQFREVIPRYMTRHKVKAGITGWAQVNGYRGDTSLEVRIKYDLYYMENWSLIFDIEILFMTLFTYKAYKNAY